MTGRTQTIEGIVTAEELRALLFAQCEKRGGASALARKAGVPNSVISEVLTRKREVSPAIANALGYMAPGFFIPSRQSEGTDHASR